MNVHQLDVKSMKDRDRFEVIKEELIKHPERSNEKNKQGETPLHECAKKGSGIERMIELFVSHGGDCNIPNSDGLTVLHINCQYGGGLIDLFVQKGAKVNALDNMGQPPVFYALATRDVSVIEASLAALHSQPGIPRWNYVVRSHIICKTCPSLGPSFFLHATHSKQASSTI